MPSYIVLANFTDQGIRTVKESPARQRQFEQMAQQHRAKVQEIYLTMALTTSWPSWRRRTTRPPHA